MARLTTRTRLSAGSTLPLPIGPGSAWLRGLTMWRIAGWVLFCLWTAQAAGAAEASVAPGPAGAAPAYADDRILVQPKREASLKALARFHSAHQARVLHTFEGIGRLQVVSVPKGETVPGIIYRYQQSGLV
jgi:hypothetical protein